MANVFLGGTLNLKINGVLYRLAGSFSDSIGGIQREGKAGPDGVHGFMQKYGVPTLDVELVDDGTVSTDQLQSLTNTTLTVELDNGKTVVYTQAWQEGDINVDFVEAKIKTKFAARVRTEIASS